MSVFFPPFWNLVPVGHATWNNLDWSCYLCRRALVPPLGCAPWACPTSPSLHRSHCWPLGASWGPAITRAQITAVGRPPLCCWLWTLSLWLTDNRVPHTQPHDSFIFAHFSFWHFYVCEYIKKKSRSNGIERSIHGTIVARRIFIIQACLILRNVYW